MFLARFNVIFLLTQFIASWRRSRYYRADNPSKETASVAMLVVAGFFRAVTNEGGTNPRGQRRAGNSERRW